jgi:hypothetical protein
MPYSLKLNEAGEFEARKLPAIEQTEESFDDWNERMLLDAHSLDTTRKDPFEKVSGQYGAPMGRANFGKAPASGIRLFKARWVDGAYDQGGAYWGSGDPIYAAVDSEIPCKFCHYVRAKSREEAAKQLGLTDAQLLRP